MASKNSEVDIEAIIREVMKENKLDPEEIPEEVYPFDLDVYIEDMKDRKNWSKRYFRGHAFSQFKCEETLCDKSWPSAYAWCIIDLKKQELSMRFKQKCSAKHVEDIEQLSLQEKPTQQKSKKTQGVYPSYEGEESVTRMVEWAVNLYLVLVGRKEREEKHYSDYRPTPEHRQDLCEMCQRLGRLCFERKLK